MKKEIRTLAEAMVRDHLRDSRNIVEAVEAGEYLDAADLDVDENVDDFYKAVEDQLSWLVLRLEERAADDGMYP